MTGLPKVNDERVKALEQELQDFTYTVSHDLAASFRHVKGFSEHLLKSAAVNATAEEKAYAEHIDTAAGKCAEMLEQLLIYSRVQQRQLDLIECDVSLLVDMARLQLSASLRQAALELSVGVLGRVYVDKELFTLAVKCILDNALKFRREGVPGHITINSAVNEDKWTMWVSDNGIGVPAAEQEKIFRMFARLQPDSGLPGVGAGLTVARRILRRHGGDLRFVDGKCGACVEFELPCLAQPG